MASPYSLDILMPQISDRCAQAKTIRNPVSLRQQTTRLHYYGVNKDGVSEV